MLFKQAAQYLLGMLHWKPVRSLYRMLSGQAAFAKYNEKFYCATYRLVLLFFLMQKGLVGKYYSLPNSNVFAYISFAKT